MNAKKVESPKKTDGAVSAKTATKLRRYNVLMGTLHLAQAIAVLALANGFTLPVVATFMTNAPGVEPPSVTSLFDFRYAWGVAAFLLVSAVAHYVIASPGYFPRYIAGLERGRNYARWVEYSISSSIMIVLIAMLVGHRGHRGAARARRRERFDDPLRPAAGEVRGAREEREPDRRTGSASSLARFRGSRSRSTSSRRASQPSRPRSSTGSSSRSSSSSTPSPWSWCCSTRRSGSGPTTCTASPPTSC